MTIQMNVHQDRRDSGQVVWWADTQDIDRLTVGGDILEEVEALAREAVESHLGRGWDVRSEVEDAHTSGVPRKISTLCRTSVEERRR